MWNVPVSGSGACTWIWSRRLPPTVVRATRATPPRTGIVCQALYWTTEARPPSMETAQQPAPSANASEMKSAEPSTKPAMRSESQPLSPSSSLDKVVSLVITRLGISSATMRAGRRLSLLHTSTPPGAS